MTAEVKVEEKQVESEVVIASVEEETTVKVVVEEEKETKVEEEQDESKPKGVEKISFFKEESDFFSDLKESEKKALSDLKTKLEEAITENTLFKESPVKVEKKKSEAIVTEEEATSEPAVVAEDSPKEEAKTDANAETIEKESPEEEVKAEAVDNDIELWGVPLLPSKEAEGTDVILLKFLRARDFKVNEAFEMLKKTLKWRKEHKIDSILGEDFGEDLASAAYMNGLDLESRPVCYNIYSVFGNEELYQSRENLLRWRFQLMEKGIQKLDLKPGGVTSLLQIHDLNNCPGLYKKELWVAIKNAIVALQDNYPELVSRNVFINVPFLFYAGSTLLSPFLTQRTKSKFVVTRPANVTETLLKYIPAEEIPVQYGGFKRDDDTEFSNEAVSEVVVKPGSSETIEIPSAETEGTLVWDIAVLGWEVSYKEEFVPANEGAYTIIVQKGKKIGSNEGPLRNSFKNSESGKIVLTVDNVSSKKKKRVLYRYRNKTESSC
ncbi:hypothetical protein BRARA_I02787 [Brassica rapa]|nr:hypothetical protein BRARA_I02787 [Brassica rapa]